MTRENREQYLSQNTRAIIHESRNESAEEYDTPKASIRAEIME